MTTNNIQQIYVSRQEETQWSAADLGRLLVCSLSSFSSLRSLIHSFIHSCIPSIHLRPSSTSQTRDFLANHMVFGMVWWYRMVNTFDNLNNEISCPFNIAK
jgi:hypothetical protein